MNFGLSDEQELLKEAARGALSRFDTLEAARSALEGGKLLDLWPMAREAGWPGLAISERHGGAGLTPLDAMLVMAELGRALAALPLLGHVAATYLLDAAGRDQNGRSASGEARAASVLGTPEGDLLGRLASGEARAAFVPARPPSDVDPSWSTDPRVGMVRAPAPMLDADGRLHGTVAWVPDVQGADVLVVVALADEAPRGVLVEAASVEPVQRFDATRSLGHVTFDGTPAEPLDLPDGRLEAAWYLSQALLGAESLGAVEVVLDMAVAYAKERFAFGRAIGSYQAVKHQLVEILRRLDNARSLMLYAGWAAQEVPAELPLAASAFRFTAGEALEHAARANISVHGGIGATWEHDAPLYFRRAQLSRRLLAGTDDAADRVAGHVFDEARRAVLLP